MTDQISLVVRRRFNISQQRLFLLLSSPEYLQQWLSPHESITLNVVEYDFRVSGRFCLHYSMPDNQEAEVHGQFLEIDQPHLICFTWQWQEPDIHAGIETIVRWEMLDIEADTTDLIVVHERMSSEDYKVRHETGWDGALMRLDLLVKKED